MDQAIATARAIYLFAVARPEHLSTPTGTAFEPDQPLRAVAVAPGLVGLIADVPLSDFAGPDAEAKLADAGHVTRCAFRHEELVRAALAQGPAMPLGFATVFSGEAALWAHISPHTYAIADFLDHTAGRDEWALKLVCDRGALVKAIADRLVSEDPAAANAGAGTRYMLEKRALIRGEKQADEHLDQLAADLDALLEPLVADWTERSPRRAPDRDDDLETVRTLALLIDRLALPSARAAADAWAAAHTDTGVALEWTGPWPAYSFVPRLNAE